MSERVCVFVRMCLCVFTHPTRPRNPELRPSFYGNKQRLQVAVERRYFNPVLSFFPFFPFFLILSAPLVLLGSVAAAALPAVSVLQFSVMSNYTRGCVRCFFLLLPFCFRHHSLDWVFFFPLNSSPPLVYYFFPALCRSSDPECE